MIGYSVNKKVIIALCLLISFSFTQVIAADATADPAAAVQKAKKSTQNKLILLESVLKSKRPKEVYASGNDNAIKIMDEAQAHYKSAKDLLAKGEYKKSDTEIQQSLKKVSSSFRMVVDKAGEQESAKKQYDDLHQRVNTFEDLFHKLPEKQSKGILDANEVAQLIKDAESLYSNKQYKKAVVPLTKASDILEKGLSDATKNQTVVYKLEFATPADEYQYEYERNINYLQLTSIVLESDDPSLKRKKMLIKMLVKKNDKIVAEAKAAFTAKEVDKAITLMEKGNNTLVKALRLGGLTL